MRVVFLGVRHWHTRLYMDPVLGMSDMQVVGVSDPEAQAAETVAAKANCPHWTDFREMCAATRPDFAFVLGRHSDMAGMVRHLIESRIPFAVEKPAAASAAELRALADAARDAGVFASVCLVMRNSPMLDAMRATLQADDPVLYASFQFMGGLATRYLVNGPWMLQRATAAGGGFLNLGIHFVDFYAALMGDAPVTVDGAAMSNALAGHDIEDYGALILRCGVSRGVIQSGYTFPAPNSIFDLHFSVRSRRHYFIARDAQTFEIWTDDHKCDSRTLPTHNVPCYPIYTRDVLERCAAGRPPLADLYHGARALDLIEQGYRRAPLPQAG